MSKTWCPVINYELCTECDACVSKCIHSVYKSGQKRPVVVYVEGCIPGCHGCDDLCPSEAIEYVGNKKPAASVHAVAAVDIF